MKDLGLKWHVLGKLTIIYILVFACAIIPVMASKYVSQAESSSSARVARIDCSVNYEFSGYGELSFDGDAGSVCMVMEEFSVKNTGDVSYTYDLSLILSKDSASASYEAPLEQQYYSLGAPKDLTDVIYIKAPTDNSTTAVKETTTPKDVTGFNSFAAGKVYYAITTDGTDVWSEALLNANGYLTLPTKQLAPDEQNDYKIIYFINVTATTTMEQQMTLFYHITCEQLD